MCPSLAKMQKTYKHLSTRSSSTSTISLIATTSSRSVKNGVRRQKQNRKPYLRSSAATHSASPPFLTDTGNSVGNSQSVLKITSTNQYLTAQQNPGQGHHKNSAVSSPAC